MSQPTIAAIVPAYNSARTLARALSSILNQTVPVNEIIVVDDGSTDDTGAIVTRDFPQVRYVRQENRGAAAARNFGVETASSDFVAFLDADDEWLPKKT